MIKQIITIDGELAIRIKKEDKLKFGDLVSIDKIIVPKKRRLKNERI